MDEISELIEGQCRTWNAGDADAFSKGVTDDCVFTNIFGQVFVGREAFRAQHERIFRTIYKGSRLEQRIDHVRLLRPDVALVDSSPTLHVAESEFGPTRTLLTKLLQVLTRENEEWRIASFHNVAVRPFPTPGS